MNGGSCEPFLISESPEIQHGYHCKCEPGSFGLDCGKITSFSFKYANKGSKDNAVTIPIEEHLKDFEMEFKFKTSFVDEESPIALLYYNNSSIWQVTFKCSKNKNLAF